MAQPHPQTQPWSFKDDAKAVRGKDGWLFLDNDSNGVLEQHAGKLLFTTKDMTHWQRKLENRVAWLENRSIAYRFVVPPVSSSVYPEFLPEEVATGDTRPVLQLIDHLAAAGSFAEVLYPIDELLAAKADHDVYERTDTHWNGHGQFIVYQCLARQLRNRVEMNVVGPEDVDLNAKMRIGDLGYKFDPPQDSLHVYPKAVRPQAYLVADNQVSNNGAMIATECDEAPDTTCVMFGDSFSYGILNFLAPSFRRLVFVHLSALDYEVVERYEPSVVISLMNERFIYNMRGPDENALSARDVALTKVADGVLRPRLPWWPAREPTHFGDRLDVVPRADLRLA